MQEILYIFHTFNLKRVLSYLQWLKPNEPRRDALRQVARSFVRSLIRSLVSFYHPLPWLLWLFYEIFSAFFLFRFFFMAWLLLLLVFSVSLIGKKQRQQQHRCAFLYHDSLTRCISSESFAKNNTNDLHQRRLSRTKKINMFEKEGERVKTICEPEIAVFQNH